MHRFFQKVSSNLLVKHHEIASVYSNKVQICSTYKIALHTKQKSSNMLLINCANEMFSGQISVLYPRFRGGVQSSGVKEAKYRSGALRKAGERGSVGH